MTLTVGIDIGGTSVRAMAFDSLGEAVARSQVPTVSGNEGVVSSVMSAWAGLDVDDPISGAGVGIPGQVDPRTGSVRLAVNLGIGDSPFPLGPVLVRSPWASGGGGERRQSGGAGNARCSLAAGATLPPAWRCSTSAPASRPGWSSMETSFGEARAWRARSVTLSSTRTAPTVFAGRKGCLEVMAAGPALGDSVTRGGPGPSRTIPGPRPDLAGRHF